MLGKIEGSRKNERQNLRWIDSVKGTVGLNLQEVSRAVEDRTLWTSLILRVTRSQSQLQGA